MIPPLPARRCRIGADMSDFKCIAASAPRPDPMQERDLVGYGETPPDPRWPGSAKIAVSFSLNIEGGGESTLANGDAASEGMLNDIGVPAKSGVRVPLVESVFEYGSRRGAWRVLDILQKSSVPVSILGVARALEQNPELVRASVARGHEIVSHGFRASRQFGNEDGPTELGRITSVGHSVTAHCAKTGRPTGKLCPRAVRDRYHQSMKIVLQRRKSRPV